MSRYIRWNAGDRLSIRAHHSGAGKGLTYASGEVIASEPGVAGGWDVYDATNGPSFYGFSVNEVLRDRAPVDVLAVMHDAADALGLLENMEAEEELQAARAAVAELVEADRALDAIDAELPCPADKMPDPMAYLQRRKSAVDRRAAALAKFGGAA